MKIREFLESLIAVSDVGDDTVDTVKSGNADKDVSKIAIAMHGTVDVIRLATKWGAELLIVHEPIYYNHTDDFFNSPVSNMKREIVEKSGLCIFRYHDHMHAQFPDLITEGEIKYLGLNGRLEKSVYYASYLFYPDEKLSAYELSVMMEKRLGLKHIRICGELNKPIEKAALCFGTPAGVFELLTDKSINCVIVGEACEWKLGEYARDAALLGINKSLIIMGHCGSERDGMKLLADSLQEAYPQMKIKYFECNEVYN